MAKAETSTTKPAADTLMFPPSRRGFLTLAAQASAGAAVAVLATEAVVLPQDDSALVKLEEQIFEQYDGACAFNEEIMRLSEIWTAERDRLYKEALAREVETGRYLTPQERWKLVTDTPACREHSRLSELQAPFYERMEALITQMFATPAHTAEGRRAKVMVLLSCILGDEWCCIDAETDYPQLMGRRLLIEFVGGEPGAMLADQFA
jgi:hypothetical protein